MTDELHDELARALQKVLTAIRFNDDTLAMADDVLRMEGDIAVALTKYRDALALQEKLP